MPEKSKHSIKDSCHYHHGHCDHYGNDLDHGKEKKAIHNTMGRNTL